MAEASRIRVELEGPVARIVLGAPERHNAISAADADAIQRHIDAIEDNPEARVLVLTSDPGPTFCSGAFLTELESGAMTSRRFEILADRVARARLPSICAMPGDVFGGGVELAMACDFRVGVSGMRMAIPAARLGICYPLGGLRRFVSLLGADTARRLLLAAEEMHADELLRVGFLSELVAPEALNEAVDRLSTRLAENAPLAVQAMKGIISGLATGSLDERAASRTARRCAESEDVREGLRARKEKRAPRFRGR